ncbi:hypothetical protein CGCF415_v004438 [Colletotrichum fructicola]|uniref:Uncharacterized protein n=1 Tax=Colletotrichum fructicola (strain Nara gc5) TaxID=1213859 RepID=L2GD59_COLFN|nr:uncharacterized protein CGMCC3_g15716 [Colletotrichum fructicola]KAF4480738.1 hypothetical protein CGGC5_v011108 [Colletotrichum fructicola Nara gc5]KAE9568162.1 hypothetical protein CGMCC3_g15716 [Colletotrichum fructicola]KAF4412848.1 hypothetical protein CFRS1_v002754 [Colletotrichum fructicola]KAF4901144.1 hypothetical protein CGCFRS4_v002952 [Colletotrichum fructicola]KAF4911504.1 hypothetical protein CGCF415_v004438 [Colletotrichum fructicola]
MADKVKELVNNITKGKDSEKEKEFSVQPIKEGGVDPKFAAHQAHPGPAVPKDFNAQEEGTKGERRAKAEALNK